MLQKTEEKPHQICILEGNKWICDIFSFAVVLLSTDVGLTLTVTGVPKSFPKLAKHRDGIKSVEKSDRCGNCVRDLGDFFPSAVDHVKGRVVAKIVIKIKIKIITAIVDLFQFTRFTIKMVSVFLTMRTCQMKRNKKKLK